MAYHDVLDLPLKTFWMMSNNVTRIQAEQDIRLMSATGAINSKESFKEANGGLRREMGEVYRVKENSGEGMKRLKALARMT